MWISEALNVVPYRDIAAMEPINFTVHGCPDHCEVWTGTQVLTRAHRGAAKAAGLPVEKVTIHNHYLGGGFGRRLEFDYVTKALLIGQKVDGPVKVIWSREEDIRHDVYRPYDYDRMSAGLNAE